MGVDALTNSAAIIAGFASAVLIFRIQRELQMSTQGELLWIPWADRLVIGSALMSLLLVILPFTLPFFPKASALKLATAALTASVLLLSGYLLAVLAHYRFILRSDADGPRVNPEPAERVIVWITVSIAAVGFAVVMLTGTAAS